MDDNELSTLSQFSSFNVPRYLSRRIFSNAVFLESLISWNTSLEHRIVGHVKSLTIFGFFTQS